MFESIPADTGFFIENSDVLPVHGQMVLSFAPTCSISDMVKKFKGIFARKWLIQYPEAKRSLWNEQLGSPSYSIGTLGALSKENAEQYIWGVNEQYTIMGVLDEIHIGVETPSFLSDLPIKNPCFQT